MTSIGRRAWRLVTVRPWLTAVVVVVIGGAAAGTVLLSAGGGDSAAAAAATTSRLVSVSTATVRKSVSATGTFTPADTDDVSFPTSAQVTSVRVAQGDTVTKGQVLGTINALSLQASLASARVTLATARAALATAEDDSDSTSAELTSDRAGVASAKAAVTSAEEDLSDATLRSPISGVVAEVNATKGEQSSGSSTSGGAASSSGSSAGTSTTAGSTGDTTGGDTSATSSTSSSTSSSADFVVIGTKKWTVSVDVDDTEVGLLKPGQQAQITTDNVSGTVFGVVSSVSVLSSSTSGSASYPVVVSVTGSPSGLHDGASATVQLIYKQATNVLTVPSAAVHSNGTNSYVYLSSSGKKTKTTVHTGLTSGITTQITSGLQSGEQVYLTVTTPGATGSNRSGSGSQSGDGNVPGGTQNGPGGGFPGGGAGGPGGGS